MIRRSVRDGKDGVKGLGRTGSSKRFRNPSCSIKPTVRVWYWHSGGCSIPFCGSAGGSETKVLAGASCRTYKFWG